MVTLLLTLSLNIITCRYIITGSLPQSGKLPVLNSLTGQKSGFSPNGGDSLHRFMSNLEGLTGTWVCLAVQNFTSITTGVGMWPSKYQKFPLFGKMGRLATPLTNFENF